MQLVPKTNPSLLATYRKLRELDENLVIKYIKLYIGKSLYFLSIGSLAHVEGIIILFKCTLRINN